MGKSSEAEVEYREALVIQSNLVGDNVHYRGRLANSHIDLGRVLKDAGKSSEAEAEFRTALAIRQKLAADTPANADHCRRLALSHVDLCYLLRDAGKPSEAESQYRQALGLWQKLAEENPGQTSFHTEIAASHHNLGVLLSQTSKPSAAESEYRAARAIYRKLADGNPRRLGRGAEARDLCERAVAIREALIKEYPKTTGYREGLAENYLNRGLARRTLGDFAGAAADIRRAVVLYDALQPLTGSQLFVSACSHTALVGLAGQAGAEVSAAEATSEADAAMALLKKAVSAGYCSADSFRTEDALDPLRKREDFKRLVEELEKKSPAKPKK